jgi:hypothetical protein
LFKQVVLRDDSLAIITAGTVMLRITLIMEIVVNSSSVVNPNRN